MELGTVDPLDPLDEESLWRWQLWQLAVADGQAARRPKPPSRRGFWRAFLGDPQPTSNELPNFLTDDTQG